MGYSGVDLRASRDWAKLWAPRVRRRQIARSYPRAHRNIIAQYKRRALADWNDADQVVDVACRIVPGLARAPSVLPDQTGRDVCVADESLRGGDPGGWVPSGVCGECVNTGYGSMMRSVTSTDQYESDSHGHPPSILSGSPVFSSKSTFKHSTSGRAFRASSTR